MRGLGNLEGQVFHGRTYNKPTYYFNVFIRNWFRGLAYLRRAVARLVRIVSLRGLDFGQPAWSLAEVHGPGGSNMYYRLYLMRGDRFRDAIEIHAADDATALVARPSSARAALPPSSGAGAAGSPPSWAADGLNSHMVVAADATPRCQSSVQAETVGTAFGPFLRLP